MRNGDARMRWVCLALLALPYFYYLPVSGILGPDEARYAAIGQEMARSGDWITPVLWGSPWFEKPPLLYWLVALFTKLGFPGEWAIRLPAAIAGLTLAALMPTLEATLVLATSVGWLALSQVAVTDIPLSVCFHLFLMQMLRQRFWTAGVFLGLAILAKGLVPLVLALPMAWQYRREWRPTLAAAVVATPWYLACYARNGRVFFDEFIWKHHVSRFFSSDLQHVQPFWFYLPVILVVLLPWTPAILRRNFEPDERPYLHTALWGLLFFSLSANKLPAYVLPLVPSLALLAARRLVRWHYILAAALFAFLPAFADWVPTAIDDGLSKAITRNVSWSFGLAALAAGFVAQRWPKRTVLVSFLVSIVALKSSVYPALAGSVSAKGSVAKCVPEDASRGYRYSSYFYAGREIPDCPPSR